MGTTTRIRVPPDKALTEFLTGHEATLMRQSTFREGGGGTGARDYESGVRDFRFSFDKSAPGDVQRCRDTEARYYALSREHQETLWLVYGVSGARYAKQITEAHSLEVWNAVERHFGVCCGLALHLQDQVWDAPKRLKHEMCGAWSTPLGMKFVNACVHGKGEWVKAQREAVESALTEAIDAWREGGGGDDLRQRRRVWKWQAPMPMAVRSVGA